MAECDIPRIVEAMKKNDIVKLEYGLFRGQAILALCRDIEKENNEHMLMSSTKTPEQEKKEADETQIKKQISECTICDHDGWESIEKNGERMVRKCACTKLS